MHHITPIDIADSWQAWSPHPSPRSCRSEASELSCESDASGVSVATNATSATTCTTATTLSLPLRKQSHNHPKFQSAIAASSASIASAANMLDCIGDMVAAENADIERQLWELVHAVQRSVPANTYVAPVYPLPR